MPVANDIKLGDIIKALQEAGGGGSVTVTWSDVSGKPTTFPPATHTHTIADITSLQTTLNGKLTATKAAAQANSTATDVAGIVADFNSLLSKLKSAGILS
ncbi:head fiber protein [Bacillus pseudomycoides]|uniref:Head fiber protein n=1 Tax=Bacillus bingmayongensis TaxID=1150157 RepID=A0ABU5JYN5_9BACI|nr:head fiber protein [Bacillus pseudomycoides]